MNHPQLFVFAGPNGAGKSMLSATMLAEGTPIFDGDKEFTKLKIVYDTTDSGTLYDAVNGHVFEDWKLAQLKARRDCAFETNFRSVQVMDTVKEFQQQGYQATLLWFGLSDLQEAIQRVKLRVAKGGHNVSMENIKTNFTEGLRNVRQFFREFHEAHFYQNIAPDTEAPDLSPLISVRAGAVVTQAMWTPDWLEFARSGPRLELDKPLQRPHRPRKKL